MAFDRQEVLERFKNVPRKRKGPRDTMLTSISDFVHFISLSGGMTIKEAEALFGVRELTILRWKKAAEENGVKIEVRKRDGTPVYSCDPFLGKMAIMDAADGAR